MSNDCSFDTTNPNPDNRPYYESPYNNSSNVVTCRIAIAYSIEPNRITNRFSYRFSNRSWSSTDSCYDVGRRYVAGRITAITVSRGDLDSIALSIYWARRLVI